MRMHAPSHSTHKHTPSHIRTSTHTHIHSHTPAYKYRHTKISKTSPLTQSRKYTKIEKRGELFFAEKATAVATAI